MSVVGGKADLVLSPTDENAKVSDVLEHLNET